MKNALLGLILFGATLLAATPAQAHHVIWLDFSAFDLSAWSKVNGHRPPTKSDLSGVESLIMANMVEDFAPFDVYFTYYRPQNGRFTRVIFYLGTARDLGLDTDEPSSNDGIGSWDDTIESRATVYAGSFARDGNFSGVNATSARIARGLSGAASHEVGHVVGLTHCHAADDFSGTDGTCDESSLATSADTNQNWHLMASAATRLTMADRAVRRRFFSIHSSRRVLYKALQARNHWAVMDDIDGFAGADAVRGHIVTPSTVAWFNRSARGGRFDSETRFSEDVGSAGDVFLTGDVTGDGQADLLDGRIVNSTTIRWYVHRSLGSSFGPPELWARDAGDVGDLFRLGDVDGDGRIDLVYGRHVTYDSSFPVPVPPDTPRTGIHWYVRQSTGAGFGEWSLWLSDVAEWSDLFLIGDVTADGKADLVTAARIPRIQGSRAYASTGSEFVRIDDPRSPAADFVDADYVMLGDADGDERADFITGRISSETGVSWNVGRARNDCTGLYWVGFCFDAAERWAYSAGDPGDLFRLGDGNDDGRVDLFYLRSVGMVSLTTPPDRSRIQWLGRRSLGLLLSPEAEWAGDAGDEGDLIP